MKVDDIRRIAVVGAGFMGYQIGMEFALAGYEVCLNDLTEENLQQALKNIQTDLQTFMNLELLTDEQVKPVMSRIRTSPVLKDAVEDVDVVVEAVFEDLELKRRVFRELDRLCPERTILVSNASGLPPSKLASATKRPDRVLVANHWNPTFLIPLVDIVRGKETSDETVETIYTLLTKVGKKPAIENEPGYVGGHLQWALWREAFSIVQKGIATPRDVDTVLKSGVALRYASAGIFEYLDSLFAGDRSMWEDFLKSGYSWRMKLIESSTEVPEWLKEKYNRSVGKFSFFEWTPESAEEFKKKFAKSLAETRKTHQKI